jgi:hypothetical protein
MPSHGVSAAGATRFGNSSRDKKRQPDDENQFVSRRMNPAWASKPAKNSTTSGAGSPDGTIGEGTRPTSPWIVPIPTGTSGPSDVQVTESSSKRIPTTPEPQAILDLSSDRRHLLVESGSIFAPRSNGLYAGFSDRHGSWVRFRLFLSTISLGGPPVIALPIQSRAVPLRH